MGATKAATTAIPDRVVKLVERATSNRVDGWAQQGATDELIEIRAKSNSQEVKEYIKNALGLSE